MTNRNNVFLALLFTALVMFMFSIGYFTGRNHGIELMKQNNFSIYKQGYKNGQLDFSEAIIRYSKFEGCNTEGLDISDVK